MVVRLCLLAILVVGCAPNIQAGTGGKGPLTAASIPPASLPVAASRSLESGAPTSSSPVLGPAEIRLAASISQYKILAAQGGWGTVPDGPLALKSGFVDGRVPALRARLAITDGVPAGSFEPELFDDVLAAGVRRFQARHGLEPDGAVGRQTVEALNVPVESRLAAMEHSLVKMAGQERTWGDRYIAINIPEATYRYVDGARVLTGPAIVGQPTWQTPELDGVIDRIDLNPSWTVPPRIASEEIWPKVEADANYLAQNEMSIVDGLIRQQPGSANPLGQVKFAFDNPYSVYLHDTNRRDLFASAMRYRSHGCVRISDPMELARALILQNSNWSEERIEEALTKKDTTYIPLDHPIPVHIVYNTAWVSEDGSLNFRADIYQRDNSQIASAEPQNDYLRGR